MTIDKPKPWSVPYCHHLLHVLRRNVDLQILLFNNEIYGLTKGQYSPTSRRGTTSPSTPLGSLETPVSATQFALGAGARFVARAIDTDQKQLPEVLRQAHRHKGASFVEIFQNCIVYNDAVFAGFTDKPVAADNQIRPEQGQPLIFGAQRNKGLRLKPGRLELEVVTLGEDGITAQDLLIHDQTNRIQATLLSAMTPPDFPVALGVLYCDPTPSYDEQIYGQNAQLGTQTTMADLNALLRKGNTWTVGS